MKQILKHILMSVRVIQQRSVLNCIENLLSTSDFSIQISRASKSTRSDNLAFITKSYQAKRRNLFVLAFFLLGVFAVSAQDLNATIDSTSIKIGEKITYSIQVETDSTDVVVFPEGQTFAPLEMVESYLADTTRLENRFRLLKEYHLTQFDSGSYTIPQQRIRINDRTILTDSMLVEVADVAVDTTKQKMYPIKPSIEVPSSFQIPSWIWWLLLILGIVAGLLFLIFRRQKKKAEEAQQIPPFEKAMMELEALDKSDLLQKQDYKNYYSRLTDSARRFIDEKVDDHAMERTTDELIELMEEKKKAGKLDLSKETINDFKAILKRADLAKFARVKPSDEDVKADRAKVEEVIVDTRDAIPPPTLEELQQDLEYQEEQRKKRKRKQVIISAVVGVVVIVGFVIGLIAIKGVDYVKDTFIGHPTKELLTGDWIRSEYGYPSVTISTPKVLIRREVSLPDEVAQVVKDNQFFGYGSLFDGFYVYVNTTSFKQEQSDVDKSAIVQANLGTLEQQGATNLFVKEDEFTTANGIKGLKAYGTFSLSEEQGSFGGEQSSFQLLVFNNNIGMQQVMVVNKENDEAGEEIANRIVNSIELQKSAQ